ncbi:hypothetical protein HPB51_023145 [Rhipicephalus microplus]|uniref:CCHC-type domain-containing protein n=1 Tax=Rhipicephalus microplus TaxID=6941 RepID=A0A9J6DWL1_RHIMP|nr:hypothetical protein HPB51_023145 [Rhipicephalus microplus]
MPQQIAMEGDDVTPEELQGNGWFSVLKKQQESRAKSHAAPQSGTQRGATAMPNATLRRVAAASRLPAMPRSHNRVIVRPGGGLNVQACSPHRILAALTMAAQLAPSVTEEDIICPNSMQKIFVVSTPSATNAAAYSRVTEIILTDQRHPATAYLSPAGITSRGVIRGADTDFDAAALNRMLIQPRNSSLLGARRIKSTETVILIFNGLKVPNYVYCGQVIYRCTLYKRQIDTCRTCGQVGHRQDVCPTPSTKVCDHCGHLPTDNPHVCNQPVCALCGEAHRTGDRECRHRYQLPYLVRRRRQRRRRRKQAQQKTPTPATSPVPAKTTKLEGPPLGGYRVEAVCGNKARGIAACVAKPYAYTTHAVRPDLKIEHHIIEIIPSAHIKQSCPVLNASFGSPATEDDWFNQLRSPDRALQHQAVQKAQKVAGELRLPVPA